MIPRDCRCPKARHIHGTFLAYHFDQCRCDPCRTANARRLKQHRWSKHTRGVYTPATFVPIIGVSRRLQALAAMGWSTKEIGELAGIPGSYVARLRRGHQTWTTPNTYARICDLYEKLWDKEPAGRYGLKQIRLAHKLGWSPPMAWDNIDDPAAKPHRSVAAVVDEVAVQRVVTGHPAVLNRDEKEQARRLMEAKGLSAAEIGRRLGTTARTVVRKRAAS